MHALPYLTVPTAAAPVGAPALAMSLAAHPERWRPLVDYRADPMPRPCEQVSGIRWYRLLDRTEGQEVWLLSWLPGQGTELHDHGAASGAFAVAAGTLTERVGPRHGRAEVTRSLPAGRVRAFGPHYVHQVVNLGTVPAVSLHVYTPGLATMNTYRVTDSGLAQRSVEHAGVG